MKTSWKLVVMWVAIGSTAAVVGADSGWTKEQTAELRRKAKEVLAPLPDKMPGAEKDTPAMIELGRRLYFDERLSINQKQSCNTCHAVDNNRAGVDNEPTSPGAFGKRGGRNSPTTLNAGFHIAQFWDGRAPTLEEQAKGPVLNPIEMAMPSSDEVIRRLKADAEYPGLFAKAFPGETEVMNYDHYARAVAAFERTLITRDRFDDFLKGDDRALSGVERKGLAAFLDVGCTTCHSGALLGANAYHKVGLVNPYENTEDLGRMEVTKDESDQFKFKVPSLRNVALTHPYFHDGKVVTLEEAVTRMAWMQLGRELTPDEKRAMVAFLGSLSDKTRGAKTSARRGNGVGGAMGSDHNNHLSDRGQWGRTTTTICQIGG